MIETSAVFLIVSVLVSGGLLAVLGDYLGSKIGKARLRLFNLRPRETARVITVLTGTLIAASTLGINFALSKPLRQGVFDLQKILKQLRIADAELKNVAAEKAQAQEELAVAKNEQAVVQQRLQSLRQNFERAQVRLKTISNQTKKLQTDRKILWRERKQLLQQKRQLVQQTAQLQAQVRERDREVRQQEETIASQGRVLQQRQVRLQALEKQQGQLQVEINRRDEDIAQLDRAIAQKDKALQHREGKLQELESQLAFLQKEVEVLEQYYQTYQDLRERRIAIFRGQVLAFGALRVVDPNVATAAIDRLLSQANRTAIEATQVGKGTSNLRVVQITKSQAEQLVQQIQDGQEYVVRILSAGNYVQGEKEVRVFADVALNQKLFEAETTIATVSLDSFNRIEADLEKRLDLLLSVMQFRSRRAGIVGNIQVEEGNIKTLINFLERLSKEGKNVNEIKAIASTDTYTVGPLKVRLVALQDREVVFSTKEL